MEKDFKYTRISLDTIAKDVCTFVRELRGAYRNDIVEFCSGSGLLNSEAPKVIRRAKEMGMYSVPDMRDYNKGTFYQFD